MTILNTRGKLASLRPANTNEQQLYVTPAGTEVDGVLRICNQDSIPHAYRVARCDAAHGDVAANTDDFVAYDIVLDANWTHSYSFSMAPTETIRVKVDLADKVSFVLEGNKKVVS